MESFKCPHCGNSTWAFSYSCAFCGKLVRTDEEIIKMMDKNNQVCYACGLINENNGNFCKNCGFPITEEGRKIFRERDKDMPKIFSLLFRILDKSSQKDIIKKMKVIKKMSDEELDAFFKNENG